jgi:hypothetical protein
MVRRINVMKIRNAIKTTLLVTFLLGAFLFVVYATTQIADAMGETETTETETETDFPDFSTEVTTTTEICLGVEADENYFYIFCEVVETTPETFTALLPNGNLETFYMIQDPPIDDEGNPWFSVVVFRVEKGNESNLDAWRVLTVN